MLAQKGVVFGISGTDPQKTYQRLRRNYPLNIAKRLWSMQKLQFELMILLQWVIQCSGTMMTVSMHTVWWFCNVISIVQVVHGAIFSFMCDACHLQKLTLKGISDANPVLDVLYIREASKHGNATHLLPLWFSKFFQPSLSLYMRDQLGWILLLCITVFGGNLRSLCTKPTARASVDGLMSDNICIPT